jgi:DNA-binding MarR family transcriptional regulator
MKKEPAKATLERVEGLVRRLRRVVGPVRPEAWREVDLTITQLKALFILHAHQPLSLSALAEELGVSLASASALVERLVRLSLVERSEDPDDRRHVRLRLAAEGEGLLARLEDRALARLREGLERMSPHGLAALETALVDLSDALEV